MWPDLGELIALALGIAISPLPILGVVIMLLSPKGMRAGAGFAIGWLAGVGFAVVGFSLLSALLPDRSDEQASTAFGLAPLILGALLVVVGVVQMRRKRSVDGPDDNTGPDASTPGVEEAITDVESLPRWLSAVDNLTPTRSLLLGFGYAFLRPKNLLIAIAAGLAIGRSGSGIAETAIAWGIFTAIASVTIAAPPLAYAFGGPRVRRLLLRMRGWLLDHLSTITGVTLVLVGAALIVIWFVRL